MSRIRPILLILFLPGLATAQTLHQQVEGQRLAIGLPCAHDVTVSADPSPSGKIVLDAAASHPEELSQLDFAGGADPHLKVHGRCWNDGSDVFQPTLSITLHVPAALPLSIEAGDDTAYHVDVGGPLSLDASGAGRLDVTQVTSLTMDISGSNELHVGRVTGPVTADMSGSGSVSIARGTISALRIEISGNGHFTLNAGTAERLSVEDSGAGMVRLGGMVGDATLSLSGSGNVVIGHLTGRITQEVSGSGTVQVLSR